MDFKIQMQNANYVHKRDITTILSQFHAEIQATEQELNQPHANQENLERKLNKMINEVERDLRLKTQAIIRNNFAQSAAMPFRPVKFQDSSFQTACDSSQGTLTTNDISDVSSTKTAITSPTPKDLIVVPRASTAINLNVLNKTKSSQNSTLNEIKPIHPIVPKTQPSRYRASTTTNPLLRRRLPMGARHDLPMINRHDPLQPPPPLPPDAVDRYGLNQLLESGLLSQDATTNELKELIVSFPIAKDPPPHITPRYTYQLDKKSDTNEPKINLAQTFKFKTVENNSPQKTEKDDPEAYLEGKFVFTLINGVPDYSSNDFQAFKREYQGNWEPVEIILEMLRSFCKDHGLTEQRIIGKIVYDLSLQEPDFISKMKLVRCFVDRSVSGSKKQTKVGFGFIGPDREHKAATVIQSIFRGFHARRFVRQIRRIQSAKRIINRFFHKIRILKKFRDSYRADFKRKLMNFEASQNEPSSLWRPDAKFVVVHIIEGHFGSEIGRIQMASNPNCSVIFYTRTSLPINHIDYARSVCTDFDRFQFVTMQQKLPKSLPIEDVLASDSRSLTRIRELAHGQIIHVLPSNVRASLADICFKLSALSLAPLMKKILMFTTRDAIRRLLISCKAKVFESSEEIFDKHNFCRQLTSLCVSHISTAQWRIMVSTGLIGWLNTNDIILLERLKANTDNLTQEDLEDESFQKLLEQNIATDLNVIVETRENLSTAEFLKEAWMHGATIEASPRQIKCACAVAVFIPPVGEPLIIGSYEHIFLSAYEPFAAIYPAINVNTEKLKKNSTRIASKLIERKMVGYNIIEYWCSLREVLDIDGTEIKKKMGLIADDIKFAQSEQVTPIFLLEQIIGEKFNPETMSFGSSYAYVQEKMVLPEPIEIKELLNQLLVYSFPIDKIKFFSDFTEPNTYTMVILERTPFLLLSLVYRVMIVMVEKIFFSSLKPEDPLLNYIHAIEYLNKQIDDGELVTTALTRKVKKKEWAKLPKKNIYLFQKSAERLMTSNDNLETVPNRRKDVPLSKAMILG